VSDGGASEASDGGPSDATYINPQCPLYFSAGCCGFPSPDGSCPCAPFACEPVPSECANNLTCECIACARSTCPDCTLVDQVGHCMYARGTFTVECANP
jgi:hypothetical protein